MAIEKFTFCMVQWRLWSQTSMVLQASAVTEAIRDVIVMLRSATKEFVTMKQRISQSRNKKTIH